MKIITRTNAISQSYNTIFARESACRLFEHKVAWKHGIKKSYGVTLRSSASWTLEYPHSYASVSRYEDIANDIANENDIKNKPENI